MTNAISIKGTREGLTITMATGDLGRLTDDLAQHLAMQGRFFRGGKVALALGGRLVTRDELERLNALLDGHKMTLRTIITSDEQTALAAQEMGMHVVADGSLGADAPAAAPPPPPEEALAEAEEAPAQVEEPSNGDGDDTAPLFDDPPPASGPARTAAPATAPQTATAPRTATADGEHAVFLRRNVRSGQVVHHTGNVVILGDVNPGAEVWATGDVIVWGRLRGSVRAGASGNVEAVVCALEMRPLQLRIGDCIARPDDDDHKAPARPEMARAQDGAIVVEAWTSARGV